MQIHNSVKLSFFRQPANMLKFLFFQETEESVHLAASKKLFIFEILAFPTFLQFWLSLAVLIS